MAAQRLRIRDKPLCVYDIQMLVANKDSVLELRRDFGVSVTTALTQHPKASRLASPPAAPIILAARSPPLREANP